MTATLGPRILFLHGGPGMTAELERQRFGAALPVHWWDQPRVEPNAQRPFERLVDAAVAEAARLLGGREGRVHLLASSFGAYLARALVDRVPERVGSITICGGVWDLCTAIFRLASRFAERHADVDLKLACDNTASADIPDQYVALLARVAARPDFLDCYWGPTAVEPREAMKRLATEGRLIDWPTCQSVMIAALTLSQVPLASPHPGGVRVLLGRFDPYFDESDVAAWQTLWPSSTVAIVEAGHFPHLELSPTMWMSS